MTGLIGSCVGDLIVSLRDYANNIQNSVSENPLAATRGTEMFPPLYEQYLTRLTKQESTIPLCFNVMVACGTSTEWSGHKAPKLEF
jgi:hypothetical protein